MPSRGAAGGPGSASSTAVAARLRRHRPAPRAGARRVSGQAGTMRECTCSKSRRVRSAGCAHARCVLSGNVVARGGLLRHALGEDVSSLRREAAASGVMMIPIPRRGIYRRVDGVDAGAARCSGVEDIRITAKPDTMLVPLPEGKSYLGFIFARGREPAERRSRAARCARARCEFVVERELAVL